MAFLSLYRKYRPNKFKDLVGQDHVVQTLRNAIKNERISHAYLFAGPRGTGKTSTAKVFAQALNCQEESSLEPCGECEPCRNIQSGKSIDVIEIDAASNRGIDEIRELREKVKFYPGEGKYKVYIIDEVHMLTTGAFNALLKTLEEPPANVVFILATTEPHQVISTILSRCQRFDFSLLSVKNIKGRLEYICQEEEVEYEKEALNIIAHSSNGGMRDAISILDQSISFTRGEITARALHKMLGKVDKQILSQFMNFIVNGDSGGALELVNDLIEKGKEVARFVEDLIEHSRQLLLIKECGVNSGLLAHSTATLKLIQKESELIEPSLLTNIIDILTEIEKDLKYANQPRLLLEVGIVKMTSSTADVFLQNLESRLVELESKVKELKKDALSSSRSQQMSENDINNLGSKKTEADRKSVSNSDVQSRPRSSSEQEKKEKDLTRSETGSTGSETGDRQLNIEEVREIWPSVLSGVKKEDIKTHAFLVEGKPVKVEEDIVYIQFPENKNFHKKGAEKKKNMIGRIFNKNFSGKCQLEFVLAGTDGGKKKIEVEESHSTDDMVEKVVELFDGEVIRVNHDLLEK